jgi:hypothetical protein
VGEFLGHHGSLRPLHKVLQTSRRLVVRLSLLYLLLYYSGEFSSFTKVYLIATSLVDAALLVATLLIASDALVINFPLPINSFLCLDCVSYSYLLVITIILLERSVAK